MSTEKGQAYDPFLPGETSDPARDEPRRSVTRSLGLVRITVLWMGTLVTLAVVGFLAFLWRGASEAIDQDDEEPAIRVWRRILDSGWLLRLVTLSSLLFRVVVAAQSALVTEMLASLIIEGNGCLLPDLARLSLTRCQTAGPFQLAIAVPRQVYGAANFATAGLLAILLIVTAATQFTSTILLTDFGGARIVDNPTNLNVSFGFEYSSSSELSSNLFNPYAGVDYWTSRPPAYLRFAEVSTPPVEEDGFYDTGFTTRAFLPFINSTQRVTVRKYEGPATVVDARVVCIRPRLDVFSFELMNGYWLSLTGTVAMERTYKGLKTMYSEAIGFSCLVDTGKAIDRPPQRKISLCPLDPRLAFLQGGDLRPDLASYTFAYLLINSTATSEAWRDGKSWLETELTETTQSQGTWKSLRLEDTPTVGIDATLCFVNPIPWDYRISAASSGDGLEPTLRWNLSTGAFSSDAARSLLGAVREPASPEDRSLLRLVAPADWTAVSATNAFNTTDTTNYIWTALKTNARNVSLSLSPWENGSETPLLVPHRAHVGLFQDILAHTEGNAALALQALFFTLLQMAHADYAAEFNVAAEAKVHFSRQAIIPVRWLGFIGFCVITGTHIALTLIVAVVFIIRTRASMLGNAWQAVGQAVDLAGGEIVHTAARKTDREVEKYLRTANLAERRVRLRFAIERGEGNSSSR